MRPFQTRWTMRPLPAPLARARTGCVDVSGRCGLRRRGARTLMLPDQLGGVSFQSPTAKHYRATVRRASSVNERNRRGHSCSDVERVRRTPRNGSCALAPEPSVPLSGMSQRRGALSRGRAEAHRDGPASKSAEISSLSGALGRFRCVLGDQDTIHGSVGAWRGEGNERQRQGCNKRHCTGQPGVTRRTGSCSVLL